MENKAIIDIGSNSIRYSEFIDGKFSKKEVYTTRLASGIVRTGELCPESVNKSIDVIKMLAQKARNKGLKPFAYATSAVRDAKNKEEFLNRVKHETSVEIDVLSGENEAKYAYLGATDGLGGLIDIGGGSTQIITDDFRVSFPMGCVRGKDFCCSLGLDDFASQRKEFEKELEKIIVIPELSQKHFTGVGGTITTLAMIAQNMKEYEPDMITGYRLTLDKIEEIISSLDSMGDDKRAIIPALKDRYDVILYGASIIAFEMKLLSLDFIYVSDRDGLEGYCLYGIN